MDIVACIGVFMSFFSFFFFAVFEHHDMSDLDPAKHLPGRSGIYTRRMERKPGPGQGGTVQEEAAER